jgi:hypothetical protein
LPGWCRPGRRNRRHLHDREEHWNPGDDFYDSERARWRIVRVLDVEPGPPGYVDGVLVVEPA